MQRRQLSTFLCIAHLFPNVNRSRHSKCPQQKLLNFYIHFRISLCSYYIILFITNILWMWRECKQQIRCVENSRRNAIKRSTKTKAFKQQPIKHNAYLFRLVSAVYLVDFSIGCVQCVCHFAVQQTRLVRKWNHHRCSMCLHVLFRSFDIVFFFLLFSSLRLLILALLSRCYIKLVFLSILTQQGAEITNKQKNTQWNDLSIVIKYALHKLLHSCHFIYVHLFGK